MAIGLSTIFFGNRQVSGVFLLLSAGVLFCGGFLKGYATGFEAAETGSAASFAALRETLATEHANALRTAHERLEKETANALTLGAHYAKEKERHAQTRKRLERELASGGPYAVGAHPGPDFVRLWNEAVGACSPRTGADAAGEDSRASGASAAAGPGPSPCAGIFGGDVTARDLAAFIIYYGNRSRNMETQLGALITRIEEYNR